MHKGAEMLARRDPMLSAAVAMHGFDWVPGQKPMTMLDGNENGLPTVVISTLSHSIRWCRPGTSVTIRADWNSGARRWSASMTMSHDIPETAMALVEGGSLALLLDVPGADAWTVEGAWDFGGERQYILERRSSDDTGLQDDTEASRSATP